jgi:VWFA-related protein
MRLRSFLALAAAFCLTLPLALLWAQGGPLGTSSETVARPRKRPTPGDQQPQQPAAEESKQEVSATPAAPPAASGDKIPSVFRKKQEGNGDADTPLFKSDVTSITVDAAVVDSKGRFIPGIPQGHFRVLEDGVPQKVSTFTLGQAPMTIALVVEFSNLWQSYYSRTWYETLTAVHGFVRTLTPEDVLAVVAYDIRPEILSDFSTDRRDAQEALSRLNIAAFSESNMFDALTFTAERMSEIEGRKAILLIASGQDTFSKLNYGETRKKLQRAGVPIYAISIGQAIRIMYENYVGAITRMDWLQADNQMRTFATETGGMAFFPRFQGELPNIFQQVTQALRSQYTITYQPSNQTRDGSYRKIKVELVAPDGTPLKITDQGKAVKYQVIAKQGYTAPREVE